MFYLPHCKSESWINKSSGERDLAAGYGEEGGELAQAQHDRHAGRGDDGITEQKTQRSTRSK